MDDTTIHMNQILTRLISARKHAGLSQTQAAQAIGLAGASSFSGMELGENPLYVDRLLQLVRLYDVSLVWVLTGNAPSFDESVMREIISRSNRICHDAMKLVDLIPTPSPKTR